MNKDDINEIDEQEVEEWFSEEELDDSEGQTEETLPKQTKEEDISSKYANTQLRIVRTNLDYSIDYLKSSLGTSIDLEPQYQRRSRWDIKKRSLLIESLLLNIPIPPIFLFEIEYGQYEVVDGRQRLETLKDYLDNLFPLKNLTFWKELNGKRFKELPVIIQRGLLRRTISATVLLAETTRPDDSEIDVRMVLFNRLNTGGVQLNPQELRNALYDGHFNNMLFAVSRTDLFTNVWSIPKKTPNEENDPPKALINNALYKSMADCELVLRFFAIRETILENLKGSLKSLLDKSMKKHKDDSKESVEKSKELFNTTLNDLYTIFDSKPFVIPSLNKPSRALYDALMVAYSLLTNEQIDDKENINKKLQESLSISKSYDILLGKGNSIEAIRLRIEEAKRILMK
ncbi:MAG: DUF262 domain-containing protein [Saprospiraceae bacterium]|nr:DUF262 domain-containing protein [Saprospiraceae bacterium]MBK9377948.1 DUF262 domain-containing protein [Saprospiraceae bacterium]